MSQESEEIPFTFVAPAELERPPQFVFVTPAKKLTQQSPSNFVAPARASDRDAASEVQISGIGQHPDGINIVFPSDYDVLGGWDDSSGADIPENDNGPASDLPRHNSCDCELCNEIKLTVTSEHAFEWVLSLRDAELSINDARNQDQMTFNWGVDKAQHKIQDMRDKLGILQTQTVMRLLIVNLSLLIPLLFSPLGNF